MPEAIAEPMSAAAFLDWSRSQVTRYELVDRGVIAMAPERARHNLVKSDTREALKAAVGKAGVSCTVFGDGMSVVIDDTTVYEPDVVVACGPVDLDSTTVAEPLIIVEVLSPGTAAVDTGRKLGDYLALASIRHVLIIDAERRRVVHHGKADDGRIATTLLADGTLHLAPPGIDIEIGALFAGVI